MARGSEDYLTVPQTITMMGMKEKREFTGNTGTGPNFPGNFVSGTSEIFLCEI